MKRGRNPLGWLVARLIGFPTAGAAQGITVTLIEERGGERWIRQVGKHRFSSYQQRGRGKHEWLIRENFGPVAVYMALVVEGERLRYFVRKWTLLGIPMPLAFGPRAAAFESIQEGKFRFEVEVGHALTGLIVRYEGSLEAA